MTDMNKYAQMADLWMATRKRRLKAQQEVDAIEKDEKKLKAELINALREHNTGAIGGAAVTVTLKVKRVATAVDWKLIHEYIVANDAWDIMQKRLTQTAIDLRWEDGVAIPGVQPFPVDDLTYTEL